MAEAATVERFSRVDTSVDPKFFVRFVDAANEMASVQACKRRMEALLQPRVGQRILDLGCGTGDDARALARLVAPGRQVIGVANSEVMLAEARRRAVGLAGRTVLRSLDGLHRRRTEAVAPLSGRGRFQLEWVAPRLRLRLLDKIPRAGYTPATLAGQ